MFLVTVENFNRQSGYPVVKAIPRYQFNNKKA